MCSKQWQLANLHQRLAVLTDIGIRLEYESLSFQDHSLLHCESLICPVQTQCHCHQVCFQDQGSAVQETAEKLEGILEPGVRHEDNDFEVVIVANTESGRY